MDCPSVLETWPTTVNLWKTSYYESLVVYRTFVEDEPAKLFMVVFNENVMALILIEICGNFL